MTMDAHVHMLGESITLHFLLCRLHLIPGQRVLANTTWENKETNRLFFVAVLRSRRVEIQVPKKKQLANMSPLLLFIIIYS